MVVIFNTHTEIRGELWFWMKTKGVCKNNIKMKTYQKHHCPGSLRSLNCCANWRQFRQSQVTKAPFSWLDISITGSDPAMLMTRQYRFLCWTYYPVQFKAVHRGIFSQNCPTNGPSIYRFKVNSAQVYKKADNNRRRVRVLLEPLFYSMT